MNINLRIAKIEDLPLLKYWDKKPHVVFATGGGSEEEDDWMEEQLKHPSKHVWIYIAQLEDQPIGVLQIIDPANEETHYWGEYATQNQRAIDIWIGEEDNLGKGYGTQMMKIGIAICFEKPEVTEILIDPLSINKRAIKFYQKMGFVFVENRDFEYDNCDVYILKRQSEKYLKFS
jgi:aminoglycoside 6'-N-acetyltransferase